MRSTTHRILRPATTHYFLKQRPRPATSTTHRMQAPGCFSSLFQLMPWHKLLFLMTCVGPAHTRLAAVDSSVVPRPMLQRVLPWCGAFAVWRVHHTSALLAHSNYHPLIIATSTRTRFPHLCVFYSHLGYCPAGRRLFPRPIRDINRRLCKIRASRGRPCCCSECKGGGCDLAARRTYVLGHRG